MEKINLHVEDSAAFLYMADLKDIFEYKDEIDVKVKNDEINVLNIIWSGKALPSAIDKEKKSELYKWLNLLPIPSIAVVNGPCSGDLLELIMMCDLRLGGKELSIQFPEEESGFIFDFIERCQLLMGKSLNGYGSLLKATLSSEELYKCRFLNQIIDMEDMLGEIKKYITRILGNKGLVQVKAIMACFNNYKHLGMKYNEDMLLEQEAKQFCNLIYKEYYKK